MSVRDGDVDFRSMRPVTSIIRARNLAPEWRIEPRCNVCRLHEAPLLNAASVLSQVEQGLVHLVPILQILEGIGPLMTTWPHQSTIKKDSLYGHRDHMGIPGRVRRGVDEGAERMGYDLDKLQDSVATTFGGPPRRDHQGLGGTAGREHGGDDRCLPQGSRHGLRPTGDHSRQVGEQGLEGSAGDVRPDHGEVHPTLPMGGVPRGRQEGRGRPAGAARLDCRSPSPRARTSGDAAWSLEGLVGRRGIFSP
jgi:hypothetical protein